MIRTKEATWKPVRAGGHIVYNWEARICGRPTGWIYIHMETDLCRRPYSCVYGKPDRAGSPVTNTL